LPFRCLAFVIACFSPSRLPYSPSPLLLFSPFLILSFSPPLTAAPLRSFVQSINQSDSSLTAVTLDHRAEEMPETLRQERGERVLLLQGLLSLNVRKPGDAGRQRLLSGISGEPAQRELWVGKLVPSLPPPHEEGVVLHVALGTVAAEGNMHVVL
jgi:hypothetical protein